MDNKPDFEKAVEILSPFQWGEKSGALLTYIDESGNGAVRGPFSNKPVFYALLGSLAESFITLKMQEFIRSSMQAQVDPRVLADMQRKIRLARP